MRRTLLLLSLFAAACTGRPEPRLGFEPQDSTDHAKSEVPPPAEGRVPVRVWEGKLEGNIPVLLCFVEEDGVLRGDVTYTATRRPAPIRVLGTHKAADGSYRLLEMTPDAAGTVTGIFTGTVQGKAFTGEWFSPKDGRQRPFQLTARDTLVSEAAAAAYRLQKGFRPGRYVYRYGGEEGPSGLLEGQQRGNSRVGLTFSTQRGAPSYNMADFGADSLLLRQGWEVRYLSSEGGAPCGFRARFFTDFAVVEQTGSDEDCGFGSGASIDGIYIRGGK